MTKRGPMRVLVETWSKHLRAWMDDPAQIEGSWWVNSSNLLWHYCEEDGILVFEEGCSRCGAPIPQYVRDVALLIGCRLLL